MSTFEVIVVVELALLVLILSPFADALQGIRSAIVELVTETRKMNGTEPFRVPDYQPAPPADERKGGA